MFLSCCRSDLNFAWDCNTSRVEYPYTYDKDGPALIALICQLMCGISSPEKCGPSQCRGSTCSPSTGNSSCYWSFLTLFILALAQAFVILGRFRFWRFMIYLSIGECCHQCFLKLFSFLGIVSLRLVIGTKLGAIKSLRIWSLGNCSMRNVECLRGWLVYLILPNNPWSIWHFSGESICSFSVTE